MTKTIKKLKHHFWHEIDQKDWLLLWTTIVFFGFVSVGLVSILLGRSIDESYIELLKMVSNVIMSVVAGVFGLNIAAEFKKDKEVVTETTENTSERYEQMNGEGRV